MEIKWYRIAVNMVNSLFRSAIAALSEENSRVGLLSKQLAIKTLQKELFGFMVANPYSEFEIQVLPPDALREDNPILTLKVKNFEFFKENQNPRLFRLVIQPTWESINVYQSSVTGKKWIKLK